MTEVTIHHNILESKTLLLMKALSRGDLQGPNTTELSGMRTQAAQKIARQKEFEKDPIATALAAEDSFLKADQQLCLLET